MAVDAGSGYLFGTFGAYTDFPTITNLWIPDPSFPECLTLAPDVTNAQAGTFQIITSPKFSLYGAGGYLGLFSLGDLPNGFQITAISQLIDGVPNSPQPSSVDPNLETPYNVENFAGTWDNFNIPDVGLSTASPVFVPATMGLNYLVGWTMTRDFDVPAYGIAVPANTFIRVAATSSPVDVFGDPIQGQTAIGFGFVMFRFTWSYDTDACAGVTPVTGATVTDPITGAISWSVPLSADGTIIEVENSVGDLEVTYLDNAITTYTPTMSGALTIRLYASTLFPICKSSVVTLNVTVTVPFDFTMGQDGITTGIFLGGASPLQFIGNPSGIYTIVPGKTHDTLYERIPAVTSQNVKIPDPSIITAYVGE